MEAYKPNGYGGQEVSSQDEKGRFVLPAPFRKSVAKASEGANTLCLAKHHRWKCLTGFGTSRTDGFEIELDREEAAWQTRIKAYQAERAGIAGTPATI